MSLADSLLKELHMKLVAESKIGVDAWKYVVAGATQKCFKKEVTEALSVEVSPVQRTFYALFPTKSGSDNTSKSETDLRELSSLFCLWRLLRSGALEVA